MAGPAASECNQRGEIVRAVVNVERSEWFTIVDRQIALVFRHDATPPESIGRLHGATSSGRRANTYGQVVHAVPGETLFLQNGHTGIRVTLARGAPGSDERFVPGDKSDGLGERHEPAGVGTLARSSRGRRHSIGCEWGGPILDQIDRSAEDGGDLVGIEE